MRLILVVLLLSLGISSVTTFYAENPSPGSYRVVYDRRGGEVDLKIKLQNDSLYGINYTLNVYDMGASDLEEGYVAGNTSWIKLVDNVVEVPPKSTKYTTVRLILPFKVEPGKYELGVEVKGVGVCVILADVIGRNTQESSFPVWVIPIIFGVVAIVVLVIWKMKKSGGG